MIDERTSTPDPPEGYSHRPEAPFEDQVVDWFRAKYGDGHVQQQRYQPAPRWFCDIYVDTGHVKLYIEVESRASEIRPGVMQALGYAAEDPAFGVPMVVAPVGHLPTETERLSRIRQSTTVPILSFDPENGVFSSGVSSETAPLTSLSSEFNEVDDVDDEDDGERTYPPTAPDVEGWKPARKRPVEVEYKGPFYTTQAVETLEGQFEIDEEYASEGYVLINGVEGEVYPCRLDIFKRTYKYAPYDPEE